jgi:hypothetical protein
MIRPRRGTISVTVAFVSAIPVACASNTDREGAGVASSDLTADAGDTNDAGSAKVTLCHMPPGNPANLQLIRVGASAVPALQAQGDGVCSSGATDCCLESGPTSLCTNLSADTANCGACGTACLAGHLCSSGACVCPPSQSLCGSACVNESSDNANCGGCGTRCGGGTTCINSACTCPTGQDLCNGTCVNPQTDTNNCGGCGNFCFSGSTCVNGACTCPIAGQDYCSGPPPFPLPRVCANPQTDNNNCGGCSSPSPSKPIPSGRSCLAANGFVCSSGTCVCPGGLTQCGNACINPATNHLGAVPASPFVPLSGTANVVGTESVPGGQPGPPNDPGCFSLVASPSSGVLTFSFPGMQSPNGVFPANCSFTYTTSNGIGFTSTLQTASFDGDTYTCSETGNGGSPDKAQLCSEDRSVNNGVGISVSLKVTRSTGAVSLTRNCTYQDAMCGFGFMPNSSPGFTLEANLSGSLFCSADAGTD